MKLKIAITFTCFCTLFLLVIAKAFYVQIVNRDNLIAYSESQFIRKVKKYPKRGHILDRNGNPLAINIKTYGIFAIPKNINDLKSTLRRLNKIISSIDVEKLYKTIKKRDKYTWVKRKIKLTNKQVEEIKEIDGIYMEEQSSRFYPNNELASQLIGFVGIDNIGLSGVEYSFNKQLKGEAQIIKYYKDAKGRPIKFESKEVEEDSKDLVLSIDKDIQAALEKYLKEGVESSQAKMGGAAIMDTQTGEIWAMANYPSYDLNNIKKSKVSNRKLSYVTDPFEPGSVFKITTIASALENKIVNPETNYYCEKGQLLVNNHIISEAEGGKGFDWLSVSDILAKSSNVGTTKIAFDLTFSKFKETLDKFPVGKKTGIELPGESRGIFHFNDTVTPLTLSNISFGQGIATTGVQILATYAVIANNGTYVKPTLLKVKEKPIGHKILKKSVAKDLQKMLVKAVYKGTGHRAHVPHYLIAGKTSTAQRVSETGGYDGYIPGFVGFPIGIKKRFVVFVYVDDPHGKYYGNEVAAPIFKKITEYVLYKNKEFDHMAKNKNETYKNVIDDVKVSHSSVRKMMKGSPNFLGLDKVSARNLAYKLNLDVEFEGYGIVRKQEPLPGVDLKQGEKIKLYFQAPVYE